MSEESDRNKDFHEQLRLQELYGKRGQNRDDPHTYVDPEDGTVYDWDHDKKAWFPKITEDFIAAYQANYGFNEEGTANPAAEDPQSKTLPEKPDVSVPTEQKADVVNTEEKKQKGEKRKPEPGWFDIEQDKNTNVYVSGLPPDITPDEFVEVMSKCGIIMKDPITEKHKIKLYKDSDGNQKGDGLCCYLKRESVALAESLLDDSEIRGYRLHVEAARFELKGQYDASKKKKKNKDYRKKMQQQQKQLDWRPEKKGEVRKRHERVVIIQNMFHPTDFEEDPLVLNEYREDLRTECEKFGEVKKVIIFDRHPDGVASVAFKEPEEADACQAALDERWFGGKKLSVHLWDGVTDYQVEETTREREERLKGWSVFLGDGKATGTASKESAAATSDTASEVINTKESDQTKEPAITQSPTQLGVDKEVQSSGDTEGKAAEEEGGAVIDSTDSSLADSDEEA